MDGRRVLVATNDDPSAELEELCRQAEREGKWLHCAYANLWFSPDELRAENAAGRFRWGAMNWTLRAPHGEWRRLEDVAAAARQEADRFRARIEQWQREQVAK
jgi:hypothetical protein